MQRYTIRRADAGGQLSVVASAERTAPVGANIAAAREAPRLRRIVRQEGPSQERTRSATEFVTRALDAFRLGMECDGLDRQIFARDDERAGTNPG